MQQKTIAILFAIDGREEVVKLVAGQFLRFKTHIKVHVVVMKPDKAAVQVR
ncbi:hypothetical protein [Grimontia indica]|uniref:hypothetical protein n=1 Tax=Grimontia indica TaxID=1056512 RepID=UPI001360B30F|nr:hypothetical protein [Grimontia indica]